MLRRFGVNYAVFSLTVDGLLVALALAFAELLRPDLLWLPWSRDVGSGQLLPAPLYLVIPGLWVLVLFFFSLYDPKAVYKARDEYRIVVLGAAFASLASAGLLYLSFRDVSRWLFLVFVVVTLVFLLGWRSLAIVTLATLKRSVAPNRRILIVGAGNIGQHVGRLVAARCDLGLTLVGYVDDEEAVPGLAAPFLGRIEALRRLVLAERIDEVVVALPSDGVRVAEMVNALLDIPLHVRVVPTSFTLALDRPTVEDFAGVPMVDLRAGPLGEYQRVVKRIFDLVVCLVLAVVSLPVMALIAVGIKRDSPGPVLFRQRRVGENGRCFTLYKFRTMVCDAEALQEKVNAYDAAGHVLHKRPDDPRVTRLGRFLRRTSLDELPQLVNVLRGDMSLVGPRPELPWLVEQYEPWQRRLVTPPGLTGWWQVSGRSELPMHLHTDVDLYYIANYSFWLDLRILWKTMWVVLGGKGAH